MNIGIIGAGNAGGALTRACKAAGHSVTVSAAHPEDAEALARETGAIAAPDNAAAVADADIVILAVPYPTILEVAAELHDELAGRIVIDVTNTPAADLDHRMPTTSAAEELAATLDDEAVVKAFNTILAALQTTPIVDGVRLDGFFATDDERARIVMHELLESLGFEPVDCGPLVMARVLEDMGLLNIRLNAVNGWPWQSGWKLVGVRS